MELQPNANPIKICILLIFLLPFPTNESAINLQTSCNLMILFHFSINAFLLFKAVLISAATLRKTTTLVQQLTAVEICTLFMN